MLIIGNLQVSTSGASMTILEKLASNLGRRDERPNVALAEILVASGDQIAIAELAKALAGGTIAVRGDAIKVLYEIGERSPALIAPHTDVFFTTLKSNNNRLHWGALSALATLAASQPKILAKRLPEVLAAFSVASVIGKDKTVSILCALVTSGYAKLAMPHLLDILETSAVNQTPMYAEEIAAVVADKSVMQLSDVLARRLDEINQPSKRARIEKVLRKLNGRLNLV